MPAFLFSPTFLLAAALAVAIGWAWVQGVRLDSCKASVLARDSEIASLRSQAESLGRQIAEQNRAVASLKSVSDAAKKRAVVAMAAVETEALAKRVQIAQLEAKIAQQSDRGSKTDHQVRSCSLAISEIRALQ